MIPSIRRKGLIVLIGTVTLSGWLAWAFGWEGMVRMRQDLMDFEDLNNILLKDVGFFKKQSENVVSPPPPSDQNLYALRDRLKTQENMIADLRTHNSGLRKKLDELYTELQIKGSGDERAASVELGTLAVSRDGAIYKEPSAIGDGRGRIVSVDDKKAFVIINMGKNAGLDRGMRFSAAKGNAQMADLEVIEVRNSLAACRVAYIDPQDKFLPNDVIRLIRSEAE